MSLKRFRGVTVSTLDSESSNPSSNLGGTYKFLLFVSSPVFGFRVSPGSAETSRNGHSLHTAAQIL